TTIETSPHVRAALAMSPELVTSSRTGITSWFVIVVVSRAPPYTLAPASRRAWAMAAPSPRLAPVTSAAAPSICMVFPSLSGCWSEGFDGRGEHGIDERRFGRELDLLRGGFRDERADDAGEGGGDGAVGPEVVEPRDGVN